MIRNIQALRALAAYFVVVVHLDALILLAGGPKFGNGGVDVFFVISGYIMVHVTRAGQASPGGFLLNRIARVAPLYWVLTVAVFVIAAVAPSMFKNTSADPVQLLMSLFFIPFQKAATGGPQPILFVGWTLNYEIFFYGLFALGLFARKREHGTLAVIGVLLALVAAGLVARPTATLPAFYSSPLILEFAAGMALALALPHMPETVGRLGQAVVLVIGALALLMLVNAPPWRATHALVYGPPSTVLVAAALLLERWGRSLDNRLVRLLGDASYSVYLTHVFVTIAATRLSLQMGVSGWTAAAAFLVALLGVTGLGLATHLLVEKPVTRLARRLLRIRHAGDRLAAAPVRPS
ncbi:MAG: acyltransferase [Caulobacterales bacterium]|nr:acyltransferase [Caulobacterales bacterium]